MLPVKSLVITIQVILFGHDQAEERAQKNTLEQLRVERIVRVNDRVYCDTACCHEQDKHAEERDEIDANLIN